MKTIRQSSLESTDKSTISILLRTSKYQEFKKKKNPQYMLFKTSLKMFHMMTALKRKLLCSKLEILFQHVHLKKEVNTSLLKKLINLIPETGFLCTYYFWHQFWIPCLPLKYVKGLFLWTNPILPWKHISKTKRKTPTFFYCYCHLKNRTLT